MRPIAAFALPAASAWAALALAAAPAAAQIVGTPAYDPVPPPARFLPDSRLDGPGIGAELRHVRRGIEQARESGLISRREARQLRREARLIGALAHRYASDGLSAAEQGELELRARHLRSAIGRPQPRGAGRR